MDERYFHMSIIPHKSYNACMIDVKKRLVLIDGHALLYRAYFAYPPTLTLNDGRLVNAAYGFTRILLGAIAELKPTHLAVSFDVGRTFRHEEYAEYKAHREKMPEELKAQEPIVNELLAALNVPIYTTLGYEADDVIGTLSHQADQDTESYTIIVTGDKDTWQLITDRVHVYSPGVGKRVSQIVDRTATKAMLGVFPEQVPDYKGLAGDTSDNIPGVRGIGPKTAVELINQFGSLERLYAAIDAGGTAAIKKGVLQKLVTDRQAAMESKKLATIVTEVEILLNWEHCEVRSYDKDRACDTLEKYAFKSLIPSLPEDNFESDVQDALF